MNNEWNNIRGKKICKNEENKKINFSFINRRLTIIIHEELSKIDNLKYIEEDKKEYGSWIIV